MRRVILDYYQVCRAMADVKQQLGAGFRRGQRAGHGQVVRFKRDNVQADGLQHIEPIFYEFIRHAGQQNFLLGLIDRRVAEQRPVNF